MQPKLITTILTLHHNDHGEYEVYYMDYKGKERMKLCFTWLEATEFIKAFPYSIHKETIEEKMNEEKYIVSFDKASEEIQNKFLKAEIFDTPTGIKESDGKLTFDIDWNFIEGMAVRMERNKFKYPRGNWKKPINVEGLNDALTRHFIEIKKGNLDDDGQQFGHIYAIACNAMMLLYQLENFNQ